MPLPASPKARAEGLAFMQVHQAEAKTAADTSIMDAQSTTREDECGSSGDANAERATTANRMHMRAVKA